MLILPFRPIWVSLGGGIASVSQMSTAIKNTKQIPNFIIESSTDLMKRNFFFKCHTGAMSPRRLHIGGLEANHS